MKAFSFFFSLARRMTPSFRAHKARERQNIPEGRVGNCVESIRSHERLQYESILPQDVYSTSMLPLRLFSPHTIGTWQKCDQKRTRNLSEMACSWCENERLLFCSRKSVSFVSLRHHTSTSLASLCVVTNILSLLPASRSTHHTKKWHYHHNNKPCCGRKWMDPVFRGPWATPSFNWVAIVCSWPTVRIPNPSRVLCTWDDMSRSVLLLIFTNAFFLVYLHRHHQTL
jgi:hypothetical protein